MMKRPTRIILLIVLLFVGRFAFGQEKAFKVTGRLTTRCEKYFDISGFSEKKNIYLNVYNGKDLIETYIVNNHFNERENRIRVKGKIISEISYVFTIKIIEEYTHLNVSLDSLKRLKPVEVIDAEPVINRVNYSIDTSKNYDLLGRWNFIAFKNSIDSVDWVCCDSANVRKVNYYFPTYPKCKDSLFFPAASFGRYRLEFGGKAKKDTLVFKKFIRGFDSTNSLYGGYYTQENNGIKIIMHGTTFKGTSGIEGAFFSELYRDAINNIGSYSINHNILTLYDNNSPRQMIFVRDEK